MEKKNSMYDKLKDIVKGLENKPAEEAKTTVDPMGKVTKSYVDSAFDSALASGVITNIAPAYPNSAGYTYTTGMITSATVPSYVNVGTGGTYTVGSVGSAGTYMGGINMGGITQSTKPYEFTLNSGGKEVVRITNDGEIKWHDDLIDVDAAAEAFKNSISMGAELKAGITEKVKRDMRDSIFEDIIGIAKTKGSLTAEDLTYLLEASKIMEKLKGGK